MKSRWNCYCNLLCISFRRVYDWKGFSVGLFFEKIGGKAYNARILICAVCMVVWLNYQEYVVCFGNVVVILGFCFWLIKLV